MEKLLTEIKRLVQEYEERQIEKTMVLTGTVKGDSIFNSLQHSLQDVNAAGQLHDSSGVEIINSLYKAVHAYIESEDKLKAELAEKNRELEIEKEKRKNVEVDLENLAATIGEKNEEIANLTKEVEMRDEKIKELARDYNRILELKYRWEAMVICKPNPDEQLRRHIAVYEDLIVDKNRKINELESHIEILKMFTTGRIDFEKELENKKKEITFLQEKLESKNKRIKELEGGDKGEGKVDRFEAGIEKLNEIVGILSRQLDQQKAVKSERDGGPGLATNSGEINYG